MQSQQKFFACFLAAIFSLITLNLTAQDQPNSANDKELIISSEFLQPSFKFKESVDVSHEAAVPTGPIASISFDETTFDFGEVEEGEIVSHTYTFTNTSDEPLILTNAKGSCGCTVPQWPKEVIAPGETVSLTVQFNSKNKKGKRNQKVTITANTNPAQSFIYLTGEVNPIDPSVINVSVLEEAETATKLNADCFAIYPNPTAELLKLDMEESRFGQAAIVIIYSETGQLMAKREIQEINGIIEFSVSHYPAGTYIAKVQVGESKAETRCFVVVD